MRRATFSVLSPMEPVAPSRTMFLTDTDMKRGRQKPPPALAMANTAGSVPHQLAVKHNNAHDFSRKRRRTGKQESSPNFPPPPSEIRVAPVRTRSAKKRLFSDFQCPKHETHHPENESPEAFLYQASGLKFWRREGDSTRLGAPDSLGFKCFPSRCVRLEDLDLKLRTEMHVTESKRNDKP